MLLGALSFLSPAQVLYGQVFSGDARSAGMACTGVALTSSWSALLNPSGLSGLARSTLGVSYENCYLVPDLGTGAFSGALVTHGGTLGLGYMTTGNSCFRENLIGFAYGRSFGTKIRAGIGIHYLAIRQPADYESLSAIVPAMGIQAQPLPGLILGVCIVNPAEQSYNPKGYLDLPRFFYTGISYQLGDEVLLCAEAEKSSRQTFVFRGGFEIMLQQRILGRFGIFSGEFPGYSFGIGLFTRSLTVDIGATHHPVLGFSPSITFTLGNARVKI